MSANAKLATASAACVATAVAAIAAPGPDATTARTAVAVVAFMTAFFLAIGATTPDPGPWCVCGHRRAAHHWHDTFGGWWSCWGWVDDKVITAPDGRTERRRGSCPCREWRQRP